RAPEAGWPSPPEGERYLRSIALAVSTVALIGLTVGSSVLCLAAEPPRVSLLASSSREIRFRAEFPAPTLEEVKVQDRTLQELSWPDLGLEGEPGDPGIPTLRVRVALPPSGNVDLESSVEPLGSMGGATFPLTPALVKPRATRER